MKSNTKSLMLILTAVFVGMLEVANAFYDPGTQRWLNRDPIGETGGINLYGVVFNAPIEFMDAFGLEIRPPTSEESRQIDDVVNCLGSHDLPSIQREALDLNSRLYMIDTDLSTQRKKDKNHYVKGYTKPNGPNNNTIFLSPDLFINDPKNPDFKSYVNLPSQDGKGSFKSSIADTMIHENAHLCNSNPKAPGWMDDNVHDWINSYIKTIFRIIILNNKKHENR